MFSSLNLVHGAVKMSGPPQCKNCKHFVPHVGPVFFSASNPTAQDLGKCKLLGYNAITSRTHWISSISCGYEGRFFEPK